MQVGYLLALMEFADPRLIFREGSRPEGPFRFGGSRSDLFAITSSRTYATFQKITLSSAELRDEPTYAGELLYSPWYSRWWARSAHRVRAVLFAIATIATLIGRKRLFETLLMLA